MKRDVAALVGAEYDLVVLGGGINGAAAARDAALRGLRVALVEKNDFGWATSSQSAKIAHSGMRYLQHADLKRLRESVRERNTMVANAPHLIDALPFLLPLYGHGIKGREVTALYLKIFDLLSLDRQSFADESRRIPGSQLVSPARVLNMAPHVPSAGLTGGSIWSEGLMHNTERMLMANVRAAVDRGARVANYVEAKRINVEGGRVTSVDVTDRISRREYRIGTKAVLNATGPWTMRTLLGNDFGVANHGVHLSKAFTLITRPWSEGFALTFPIRPMYLDRTAMVQKGVSLQFAIPWRGATMIASRHLACEDDPDAVTITEAEIQTYIDLINEGYPAARLERSDVRHILWGMIPAEEKGSAAPLKHYKIIDHATTERIEGLVSLVGVKFTTARDVAEKAIDAVATHLNTSVAPSTSRTTPLWGGDIEFMERFRAGALEQLRSRLAPEAATRLVRNYGSGYANVVRYVDEHPSLAQVLPDSCVTEAEVMHAMREEMALNLTDVVLRRTDLGSLERPSDTCVSTVADVMARELGWDDAERTRQVDALEQTYQLGPLGARA
jgi:glycerol-3-phosphate dehydrogenase